MKFQKTQKETELLRQKSLLESYEITVERLELFKKDYLLNIFLYKVQSIVCIKFWGLVFACMYTKAYNRKYVLILQMEHNIELPSYFDSYQHKQLIIAFSLSAVFSNWTWSNNISAEFQHLSMYSIMTK